MPPIPEMQIDGVTGEILNAYSIISRGRRFAGQAGVPLPIAISDIDAYTTSRGTEIDRDEFDAAIFALDNHFRKGWAEEDERRRKREKRAAGK